MDTEQAPGGKDWKDTIDLSYSPHVLSREFRACDDEDDEPDLVASSSESEEDEMDVDNSEIRPPGEKASGESATGHQPGGASSKEELTKPKFPTKYVKIADMDARIIEALKTDLSKTTQDWVAHGQDGAMIGLPWHTMPDAEHLQSIWSGADVSRIKASPAWFALRAAILKANPWMHMWNDPLGSINILRVLKEHKSQEHWDAPDGHLTLVFRLQGLAGVRVWTHRRNPNTLSTASGVPSKTYRVLPLKLNQAYAIDACRVGHFAGYSEGELLAIWRLGLNMDQFRKAREREASASPEQLNAEASAKWEGAKVLVMPSFDQFTIELDALSALPECIEPSGQDGEGNSDPSLEDEGPASNDVADNARSLVISQTLSSEEHPVVEFMVNESAVDIREAEVEDAVMGACGAVGLSVSEAETEDPRGPPEADPVQYDRSWSTQFEIKCPEGFELVSQEKGCPVVFKTKRCGGNSHYHLEFEQCKLPIGHRDRVKVRFRGRSMKQAGMTIVHREASMRSTFKVVDLQAYTLWMRRGGGLFNPSFCQGCCHSRWNTDAKGPARQAE
jgi:hypothetical protein